LLHCHASCAVETIVEALALTMVDLFPADSSLKREHIAHHWGISLLDFAQDKHLHWRFLINQGIVEDPGGGLRIPYYQQDGTLAPRHRLRRALAAKDGSSWTEGTGEIILYGLEHLGQARKMKSLIYVEGETDTLTLRFHGYPSLGIPGADMVRATLKTSYFEGIERLYVFQEPDLAGERFVATIAASLEAWNWHGKAFIVTLSDAKDPNELHKRDWKAFKQIFQGALDQAQVFYERTPSHPLPLPQHPRSGRYRMERHLSASSGCWRSHLPILTGPFPAFCPKVCCCWWENRSKGKAGSRCR
jgi:putative DNA primase/helicase